MVRAFLYASLLMFAIPLAGCVSGESSPPETKASDVSPQLSPEQQAYVDANKGKPFENPKKKR